MKDPESGFFEKLCVLVHEVIFKTVFTRCFNFFGSEFKIHRCFITESSHSPVIEKNVYQLLLLGSTRKLLQNNENGHRKWKNAVENGSKWTERILLPDIFRSIENNAKARRNSNENNYLYKHGFGAATETTS